MLQKVTNGKKTKYVYGLGLIGEEKQNCGFKTYHYDLRGSTVAITNMSGTVTDTFTYDTYGKMTSRTGSTFVIFGYNGRDGVVTDVNGLIYMRARYYSPELRRFVNTDIVAGEITNGITLNRYAYANANPVTNVDPLGLMVRNRFAKTVHLKDGGGAPTKKVTSSNNNSTNSQAAEGSPSYQYSEDEYWENLLAENDAIYVVDYGLPVVGHAYLLLKNEDGSWIKTHFATRGDNPIEKIQNAKIYTKPINTSTIISSLSKKPDGIDIVVTGQKTHFALGFIPITMEYSEIKHVYTSGVQYVPLKGDFQESVDKANNYDGSKYGGYDLLSNNCAHYVQDVLEYGTVDNAKIEDFLNTSNTIIPSDLYDYFYMYSN